MFRKLLVCLAVCFATPGWADWREATSRNFLVYGEGSEAQLRAFAAKLEKFHFVLRTMHNITRAPPPNRVRVFLMSNIDAVRRTFPYPVPGVAGYSEFGVRGPMIVGTSMAGGQENYGLEPQAILLHEYSHHFMFGYFPATYPTWYQEGFAEFWGQVEIRDDNVVRVGLPAPSRLLSFQGNRWVPIGRILSARSYSDAGNDLDLIYAEGWLLVRYLFTNHARADQLASYLSLINHGRTYEQAMNEAFGANINQLDSELRTFSQQTQYPVLDVPYRPFDVGPITVRQLRPAEDALVRQEIQLGQGILARNVADFARTVRSVASRYPEDPYALLLLTEAERLAGNRAAATEAAAHLIRVDPENARGLMYEGLLQAEALQATRSSDDAAWDAARQLILRANRLAPQDPLILKSYYDSFRLQGVLPPAPAQNALFRALELAPGDGDLRYQVAADFEERGMIHEAITIIRPTALAMRDLGDESERHRREREREEEAYRGAGETHHETARQMLSRLEALQHSGSPTEAAR